MRSQFLNFAAKFFQTHSTHSLLLTWPFFRQARAGQERNAAVLPRLLMSGMEEDGEDDKWGKVPQPGFELLSWLFGVIFFIPNRM